MIHIRNRQKRLASLLRLVLADESVAPSSSHSVKLEAIEDEASTLLIPTDETSFDQLAEVSEAMPVSTINESIVDYDFADLTDLSHLTNGPQQLISSDTVHSNETPFDSF